MYRDGDGDVRGVTESVGRELGMGKGCLCEEGVGATPYFIILAVKIPNSYFFIG